MLIDGVNWLLERYRPREGWVVFILLGLAVASVVTAVARVKWVPEGRVVIPTAVGGFLLGSVLAKRPLTTAKAWLILMLYGFLLTTFYLGQLEPRLDIWAGGWATLAPFWRQNGALLADRLSSWFVAVWHGGSSHETIVFAYLLGLWAWFLCAYVAWSSYRQQRPLLGLTLMGVAVALNGYFGRGAAVWTAVFVGLCALVAAVLQYAHLEQEWDAHHVDYSDQIRWELALHAGLIALILLACAFALPTFSLTKFSQFFQKQPAVQTAQSTLTRLFAGVQPRRDDAFIGQGSNEGYLPRAYLLQDAPELQDTVVMTAVVSPSPPPGVHWRGIIYDQYTGDGWKLSSERLAQTAAHTPLPYPPQGGTAVHQTVHWLKDSRTIRYTLGLPLQFAQPTTTYWLGLEDYVRSQGEGTTYTTLSQAIAPSESLNNASLRDVPPVILARYTALPAIPSRVHDLAEQIAGDLPTPYAQAQALEEFLHQYPYTLAVDLPPAGHDVVDFFLFESQTGYCDYYASAMVVMARSLGLPARLAAGFLMPATDSNGRQTIREKDGHSWAEIYFAGTGWVEFEPTAPFSQHQTSAVTPPANGVLPSRPDFTPPPIPTASPSEPIPTRHVWSRWLALVCFGLGVVWWAKWLAAEQRQWAQLEPIAQRYGRLQKWAGSAVTASQTPAEFLAYWETQLPEVIRRQVEKIVLLYAGWRYGRLPADAKIVDPLWRGLQGPLWVWRWRRQWQNLIVSRKKRTHD